VLTFGALLFPLDRILPIVAPLNIAVSSYLAIRYRRVTAWRSLTRRILPLVGAGIPIGLLLFNLREMQTLKLAFGVFVVLLAAAQLRMAWSSRPSAPLTRLFAGGILLSGGVVHGLFGTGGPLIVYVVGREIGEKGPFRSTLATMWIPMNTALFVDYLVVGLYDHQVTVLTSIALIPVVAAIWLGEILHARLDARRFMKAVWLLLLVGGIIVTLRAAMALAA
jgi:hypothetical protein